MAGTNKKYQEEIEAINKKNTSETEKMVKKYQEELEDL